MIDVYWEIERHGYDPDNFIICDHCGLKINAGERYLTLASDYSDISYYFREECAPEVLKTIRVEIEPKLKVLK